MKTLFDDDMPRNSQVTANLVGGPNDTGGHARVYYAGVTGDIYFAMTGFRYDYESPGVYRYREPVTGGPVRTCRPFVTLTHNGAIRPSASVDADF